MCFDSRILGTLNGSWMGGHGWVRVPILQAAYEFLAAAGRIRVSDKFLSVNTR